MVWQTEVWSIDKFIPYARNPRKNDAAVDRMMASIREFGFKIPYSEGQKLGDILGPLFGDNQFDNIIKFMSGRSASECDPAQAQSPGTEKCIALIYEGVNAVSKRYPRSWRDGFTGGARRVGRRRRNWPKQ